MIKKETGIKFSPSEFRKLNNCVFCGKVENIEEGGKCSECKDIIYKHCEICEAILRKGTYRFYSYDTTEFKRDSDINFKPNVNKVKEFIEIYDYNNIGTESLCNGCINWESRIKNICWTCGIDFINSREHYKVNGNMCEECAWIYSSAVSYPTKKYE